MAEDSEHFLHWAQCHYDPDVQAESFVPRMVYGQYLSSLWKDTEADYLHGHVLTCDKAASGWRLTLADGQILGASYVVLTTGNFAPASLSDPRRQIPGYYPSAWQNDLYARIQPDDDVALIGTGLTAVDVLMRLREEGHRGRITAISRHGWYPTSHAAGLSGDSHVVFAETAPTARAYLAAFRQSLRSGIPWRSVVNALRSHTNTLWDRLPWEEKRRFSRHLQRRWDIVRHRMAPALGEQLDVEIRSDTLTTLKGRVEHVSAVADRVQIGIQGSNGLSSLTVAHAVNCTGPSRDYRAVGSALLTGLLEQGIVRQTSLGGWVCNSDGALQDRTGNWSTTLYALGPMRWGTLFETTAIPEIRQQAAELAHILAEQVAVLGGRFEASSGTE
ncbi:hypothetical protein Gbfr_014_001 [Gluconobacter frateurii M-2]|nr:hypothetical protein Gbfr_014_001 [Gluconobacter frateurii M-2]